MTEIPIFPAGAPEDVQPEDERGLLRGMHGFLGRIARNLPDPRHERLAAARSVYVITIDPVPMPVVGGAGVGVGVLDVPQLFGPGMGTNWDVHSISATGFSAGIVNGWLNMPQIAVSQLSGALRVPFIAAGVNTFGKGQCWLRSTDRLVFVGTGLTAPTGQVLVSLTATSVADEWVGKYLS